MQLNNRYKYIQIKNIANKHTNKKINSIPLY